MLDVLIVGGGVGGMTAAVRLAALGARVALIDKDPQWRAYGAGLTITGPSLRAFDELGVLPEIRERGSVHAGMRIFDPAGNLQADIPAPPDPAPLRCTGGIMRPVLHEILAARVRRAGVEVALGIEPREIVPHGASVEATLSDGRRARYDLVVGADGIFSSVRRMAFPEAPPPRFTGQGCWRVVAPRPPAVDRSELYLGGPVKVGLVPVAHDRMYMFILEHVPLNPRFAQEQYISHLKALLAGFGRNAAGVRDGLGPRSQITYRPLEWILVPQPWYRGRVVLIGDAAHATTPHLASGAGMAVEDALVLAQELARHEDPDAALGAFMQRRIERARSVVETSVKIGELEMAGGDPQAITGLMMSAMHRLEQPY